MPQCAHAHRTVEAASRCDDRIQARCRAANGPQSHMNTLILATDPGENERYLSEDEQDAVLCMPDA